MSSSGPSETFDQLDDRFAAATAELRAELAATHTPDFAPRRSRTPLILVAAATVLIVAAGALALRPQGSDRVATTAATTPPSVVETGGAPDTVTVTVTVTDADADTVTGADTQPDARPDVATVDSDFGVAATRISDAGDDEYVLPVQSPAAAWNADGTRLLLYRTTSGGDGVHRLYEGASGASPGTGFVDLDISPSDIEQVFWSPVDPDVFHFTRGNALVAFDVAAMSANVVRAFTECDSVEPGTGPSWDGELIGLLCIEDASQLVSYRFSTDEALFAPTNGDDAPLALPSGTGFLLPVTGAPDRVLGADLTATGIFLDLDDAARSLSIVDGIDVVVGPSFDPTDAGDGTGSLVIYPVDGSPATVIIGPTTGFSTVASGASYSSTAWSSPGRVAMAVPVDASSELGGRLVVVDLATGAIDDVGAHATSGRIDYWSTTFVSIDPTGTRILFSSDRGGGISVDTYLVELG